MNKRPFAIGLLALAGLACERDSAGPDVTATQAVPPATAPVVAQADGLDARETRLVTLKLPGMV